MKMSLLRSAVILAFAFSALGAMPAHAQTFMRAPVGGQPQFQATQPAAAREDTSGPANVVGGTFEADYLHPWVVSLNGCRAVLIDPRWALTAAHCTPQGSSPTASYSRTDPRSGSVESGSRRSATGGVYRHPEYAPSNGHLHDIALIRLAEPFTITPLLQTVALPTMSRTPGRVGAVASFDHGGAAPAGQVAVLRAPIGADNFAPRFTIQASSAGSTLCPGDSGSGFVVVENGRATVRGVASQATVTDCATVTGEVDFTDVFAHRSWILQTMQQSDATLAGNTRVRRGGGTATGTMGVGCDNPYGTMWGPLAVNGAAVGANCAAGDTQSVVCSVQRPRAGLRIRFVNAPVINGFTMRTIHANGAVETQALPFSETSATFYGVLPAGVTREFTCNIGAPNTAPVTDVRTTAR